MKFLILFNLILNLLCVSSFSNHHIEDNSGGFFAQWISYLKRFSLVISILSGVILYYIPDSRSYARKGCCLLIDNFAEGLKTVLCLKDNTDFNQKDPDSVDSFISRDFCDNDDFEFLNDSNNSQDEFKQKRKDVEVKISRSRDARNQRHKKLSRPKKEKYQFISTLNSHETKIANQYLKDNKFSKSDIFSSENWASSLISKREQKFRNEGNDVKTPSKLYSMNQMFEEKYYNKNYDFIDEGTLAVGKKFLKSTESTEKIIATKKAAVLKNSKFDNIGPVEKKEKQKKEEYDKKARVFFERSPRIKEKLTAKIGETRETLKNVYSSESEESFTQTTFDQNSVKRNKLDQTLNKKESFPKNEVIKISDVSYQSLSDEEATSLKNEKKLNVKKMKKSTETENGKSIAKIIDSDLISSSQNKDGTNKKQQLRKNHTEIIERKKRKQYGESLLQIYEDTPIPIFTNRLKPIMNRAFGWFFGKCPHAN